MISTKKIAGGVIVCALCAFAVLFFIVQSVYRSRIIQGESISDERPVALVLGAGLKSRRPNAVLADRLETAKSLYRAGKVKKLVLSGDNRAIDYNEPQAMRQYLVDAGIPEGDLILDYAGRRTYDSCYRLRDVFGQHRAVIVTQSFHLPRALYLCNKLGVDTIGVSADRGKGVWWWSGDYLREIPASISAWLDIVFFKPLPILGKPEKVF